MSLLITMFSSLTVSVCVVWFCVCALCVEVVDCLSNFVSCFFLTVTMRAVQTKPKLYAGLKDLECVPREVREVVVVMLHV